MLSYRKLAMRVLGRPLHTGGGGISSPRPASQRAAAFILTAVMLTSLTAPAFAKTWCIEDGNITVKAGDTGNDVTQKGETTYGDTDTIITNQNKDIASSNTVTIETKEKDDKAKVTFENVNIKAGSGSALTSKGDVTLTLKGDNSLTGGISDNGSYGLSGISNNGSLTITGGEKDSLTAKGGSGTYDGGTGIYSNSLTISGGTVNATGGKSSEDSMSNGGYGIHSGSLTISGSTVNATGGDGSNNDASSGGSGINIFSGGSGSINISDGTLTATGGNGVNSHGGNGISSSGSLTISNGGSLTVSGGTVNANGGKSGSGDHSAGGSGISSSGSITISGGTVDAKGGNSGNGNYSAGGNGIDNGGRSGSITISGGTVDAKGGNSGTGDYSNGGSGIYNGGRSGSITISGGTVNAAGGNDGNGNYSYGGSGIHSVSGSIDLSGSLELTAKAGKGNRSNGMALSQNGYELDPNTFKEKLDPGANIITKDADGKVIDQVSIPRPVEPEGPVIPEESSSSSDSGSSTPSAPASPLPGLTVTDKDSQHISYTSTQSGNTLTVCVGRFTASLRISLAALRQLRAEGIEAITFQTILCSTTLSVDELLAMGGEDAEVVLTHHIRSSTLTVGGKAV